MCFRPTSPLAIHSQGSGILCRWDRVGLPYRCVCGERVRGTWYLALVLCHTPRVVLIGLVTNGLDLRPLKTWLLVAPYDPKGAALRLTAGLFLGCENHHQAFNSTAAEQYSWKLGTDSPPCDKKSCRVNLARCGSLQAYTKKSTILYSLVKKFFQYRNWGIPKIVKEFR